VQNAVRSSAMKNGSSGKLAISVNSDMLKSSRSDLSRA
jgi:hypothetical protein